MKNKYIGKGKTMSENQRKLDRGNSDMNIKLKPLDVKNVEKNLLLIANQDYIEHYDSS